MSNKILIGCTVKEKNLEYVNLETDYLFRTLNEFGGKLSDTKKIACFTENPDSALKNSLDTQQVEIRIAESLNKNYQYENALLVLQEGIKENVDVIVMLDSDVVIAKDFSSFLSDSKILIKPEDRDPFTLDEWKELFNLFNVPFPKERFYTSCSGQETIPYFNIGVVIIPKKYALQLLKEWRFFIKEILEKKSLLPENFSKNLFFITQIAFALALIKSKFPYDALPLSMNYPYSGTVHPSENPESLDPFVIHHHHCILEDGNLMHCPYENINVKIDKINTFLETTCTIKIDKGSLNSKISIRNLTMMQEFEKVTERLSTLPLDDSNPSLQYYLALSLHNTKKNFDEALIRYTKALELGFEDYMVYADRGWLYYMMGDVKNATNDLIKSLSINPYDIETKKRLARLDPRIDQVKLLCDEKSFNDIIKILSDVKLDDSNPFLQYYLALSLHNTTENFDEALIRYTKALELGFEPFWIFLNRGSLQFLQNNLNDAKIDLIKAQKIKPDNFEVHRQLNLLKSSVPEIQHFLQTIKDKDGYIAHLEDVVKEKDDYIEQVIKQYRDTINQIRSSKSWRITHPFFKKI
jgi:tetratricopeptide (TPR) repeat protein